MSWMSTPRWRSREANVWRRSFHRKSTIFARSASRRPTAARGTARRSSRRRRVLDRDAFRQVNRMRARTQTCARTHGYANRYETGGHGCGSRWGDRVCAGTTPRSGLTPVSIRQGQGYLGEGAQSSPRCRACSWGPCHGTDMPR
jgi:hypothetical protein